MATAILIDHEIGVSDLARSLGFMSDPHISEFGAALIEEMAERVSEPLVRAFVAAINEAMREHYGPTPAPND